MGTKQEAYEMARMEAEVLIEIGCDVGSFVSLHGVKMAIPVMRVGSSVNVTRLLISA